MKLLQNPVYNEDYKDGYVFFSYKTTIVSTGIALFQMGDAISGQLISHCGIISGEGKCLEATTPRVCESNWLTKYVNNPKITVFLREPVNWSPEEAVLMIEEARKYIGKWYAYDGLIGSGIYILLTFGWNILPVLRNKKNIFNPKSRLFCSELVANVMQRTMGRVGVLAYDSTNIYPSTLYEDKSLWKPWDYDIVNKKIQEGKIIV